MKTMKNLPGKVIAVLIALWICITGSVVALAASGFSVEYRPGTADAVVNMPEAGNGVAGETYTVSGLSPLREGYEFLGWTMEYEEAEYTSYEVRYLEEGTNAELAAPKVVSDQVIGIEVTENALEIAGYELVSESTQKLILDETENVINFYYKPVKNLVSYTIYYMDIDSGMELHERKTVSGLEVGETVTEYVIDIENYEPLELEKTFTLTDGENNMYFLYYHMSV